MQLYIFKYNDDEWENVLVKDPAWTRQETDYLLELCELFDLRFLIIADRYAVCATMLYMPLLTFIFLFTFSLITQNLLSSPGCTQFC